LQKPGVFSEIHKVEKEEALGPGRCKTLGLTLGGGLRIEWKWEQQVRHCLRHEEQPRKKNRLIAQEEEKQPKNHRGKKMERERKPQKVCAHKRIKPQNSTYKFSTKLVSTWCFCKIQQKDQNNIRERRTTWTTWCLKYPSKPQKPDYREMHNLTYLGFVKIQQNLGTTPERDPQLELLGVCKIHQNLKTTSQRDAQLELLVFSKIQQKAQNVFTERCITWTTGCSSKSNKKLNHHHQREMHNLNSTWCFWKSNKKLRKTPQRDAPLEILGIF
jgi:hypothetical protein